jgi:hypothetical protein
MQIEYSIIGSEHFRHSTEETLLPSIREMLLSTVLLQLEGTKKLAETVLFSTKKLLSFPGDDSTFS